MSRTEAVAEDWADVDSRTSQVPVEEHYFQTDMLTVWDSLLLTDEPLTITTFDPVFADLLPVKLISCKKSAAVCLISVAAGGIILGGKC